MEWLRWILLAIGAILIGGIYLAGRRQQQPRSDAESSSAAEWSSGDAAPVRGQAAQPAGETAWTVPDFELPDAEGAPADASDGVDELAELYVDPFAADTPGEPEAVHGEPATAAPGRTCQDPGRESSPADAPAPRQTADIASEAPGESMVETAAAAHDAYAASDPGDEPLGAHGGSAGPSAPAPERPTETPAREKTAPDTPTGDNPPVEKPAEEKLVVLYVAAAEGRRLVGAQLVEAFARHGLEHGELGAFHARARDGSTDDRGRPATEFSVANVVEPGSFDPATMDTLSTPGIVLVLRVPGPPAPMAAFERMVVTARDLARELDGRVLDEKRTPLTRQSEQLLRDELRRLAATSERNR